ncbi:asialoglycoprotein receptor 1 isoform X19 [Lates calcarifer]|uniref:Asialoglycoprotein receptor 1 isoform X15 n=1 Tax=Lates calcarifer TaxID=8187 RepID=A0AAJ8DV79_LATCA|nr:asialoglycoprotein receptor 1 isoform X15 [Lates calcarifer]XP_050932099.1 asialoglycoprotein receptor 1 isoform X16 [Lates calcarifer]XP_050932102.1 asialoglycoprotein receptor 1 isoform X19 [Lates calcarifer]
MAEEEVNYASVVFKTKKNPRSEVQKEEEETVYDEVKVRNEAPEQTADTSQFLPDKKADNNSCCCKVVVCSLVSLCVVLVIAIVLIYLFTLRDANQVNELKHNQTALLDENHNLTNLNNILRSENENLKRNVDNLTVKVGNLTRTYAVAESKIANLTAEKQNLTTRNQELETEKNNLTEQIKDLEMKNAVSVTQAQKLIDAYCPKENEGRQCKACETGWGVFQSSCYAYNNAEPSKQRTWEEAREDCKGKISDLVTVADEKEKNHVSGLSVPSEGLTEYWIGLRVKDGKWKWFDGTNLADSSWIDSPVDGHCAVSDRNQGWKSVSCGERKRWICEKAALSL